VTRTVVLDSDALIKLGKAGLLSAAVRAWRCVVPEEVYTETVVRGLQEAHPDAEAIAALLGQGLHAGESAASGRSRGWAEGLVRESGQRLHCSCRRTRILW
jgi:hypothetical protein